MKLELPRIVEVPFQTPNHYWCLLFGQNLVIDSYEYGVSESPHSHKLHVSWLRGDMLLWHNSRDTPPEITSIPPPSFPRIRVDEGEVVPQPGLHVHGLVMHYICGFFSISVSFCSPNNVVLLQLQNSDTRTLERDMNQVKKKKDDKHTPFGRRAERRSPRLVQVDLVRRVDGERRPL